jgi:hypothetical protein
MISRASAQEQAERLEAAPTIAPRTPRGRNEIVTAIMRHCASEEHAEEVITELLDTADKWCVLTSEIRRIAFSRRKDRPLPPACDRCQGELWIPGPNGYTRCRCARGKALREMQREFGNKND